MCKFTDVAWSAHTAETDTETKDESSGEEHVHVDRGRLNTSTHDNDESTRKHSRTAAPVVIDRPGEEYCGNSANVIDGEDNTSA